MRQINLTFGQVAIVDDEDFDALSRWKWHAKKCADGRFYAIRHTSLNGKKFKLAMHRQIMGLTWGDALTVDHIDPEATLDNRRSNLRTGTKLQQQHNRRKSRNNTSGFKGVIRSTGHNRWRAQIRINGKTTHLGVFPTPDLAHQAYECAARQHFGEFARSA